MNIFIALLCGKRKENLRGGQFRIREPAVLLVNSPFWASLENMGLTSNWECVKGNGRSGSVLEKDTWGWKFGRFLTALLKKLICGHDNLKNIWLHCSKKSYAVMKITKISNQSARRSPRLCIIKKAYITHFQSDVSLSFSQYITQYPIISRNSSLT